MQSTLFPACLTLNQYRIESSRDACFPCITYKKYKPPDWSNKEIIRPFFKHCFGPILLSTPGKVKCSLSVCLYVSLCLSLSVSLSLSLCLSLSLYLSVCLSVSVCVHVCVCVCLLVSLSNAVSPCISVSVSLSVCLSLRRPLKT